MNRPVRRRVAQVMGMPISLALRGAHVDDEAADRAWARALAVLHRADRVFSPFRPDSVVSRLGRDELAPADCPPAVREVLALGERARRESAGAFSIRRDGAGLDPCGVVKGWAVQRAMRHLAGLPDTDVCLCAGGDMACRTRAGAPPWRVGIEDPRDPSQVLAVVPVHNGAVATSGAAHRGAHIVDARSGRVPTALASVTVVGADLTWVDIDATAAYALGEEAPAWLAGRPGRSALLVWADGRSELVHGRPERDRPGPIGPGLWSMPDGIGRVAGEGFEPS